jgi:hypothetical protein
MNGHKKVRIWFQESGDSKKAPAIWVNELGDPQSTWFYMNQDASQILYDIVQPYLNDGFQVEFRNPDDIVIVETELDRIKKFRNMS